MEIHRIRKLSDVVEGERKTSASSASSAMSDMTAEVMKQKEEMIHCLQDELIKERLREAENEEKIRNLLSKVTLLLPSPSLVPLYRVFFFLLKYYTRGFCF